MAVGMIPETEVKIRRDHISDILFWPYIYR